MGTSGVLRGGLGSGIWDYKYPCTVASAQLLQAMAALSSALLCLGALGCLWGPTVAFVDFQGRYFITAFLENGGAEKPNFRLYVSPPPKGPPTAVQVRAHPVGGPPLRRALSLQPGTTALVRLPSAVELRGSRRAAGGAVRLAASRPVGVTVVNARGRTSLDTALALPRRLLGTRYVVVTPSLQPHDRHKEFAVVAGAWPTRLRLTPPVPILLDGVEHAAGRPLLVRLEPFQALQVQSAGDLSGTRVVATHPVALLAGHSCLQARNKACGHVSEQLLPQGYWGRVYAVPPFAPAAPGPKDHVYVVADSLGSLSFWGGGAEGAQALRGGVVLHFAVDPVRPLVLRSSAGLQVLFLAAAAARGGVAYNPFFALLPPVDAFSRSFALTAQPGFSNVAVLLAREPTPVLLDQQPLPNLHWRLIPGGPEPGHGQHSGESHATAPGFVWTEVAYGPEPGVVHFLETRGPPVGVLSFGTAPGAGFGTQAMGQPSVDILTEEDLNPPTEFYPLLESSLVMPLQFPGSCKDHVCSSGTTCHLVKHKPECVASTQATEIMFSPKTISLKDSNTMSFSSSKTTAESTPEAEPGLVSVAMNELKPQSLALVKPELETLALKEPIPGTLVVAEPAPAPFPLPVPTAQPESEPKTVSKAGSETISAAKLGPKVVAVTEPGLEAVTMAKQELGTVAGSKMVSEAKSETVGISSKGQGGITGGTCWASGLPYIYTFDGYSFPVSGGCTYMLSHCPQALPSGLPAFQLWIASSGEKQPMHFVTMRIFGVTITAVKHEFGFVQVNQQRLRLPATLHDGRLRLHFRSSELWAEAGLEHEPPALRLVYDWQHALSLQVTDGYRAHVVGLCGNFNRDPTDDVGGPDPRAFLRTWALQPPDAPCHALWAAPCAKPASPPETPGPCAILAAPKGPFSPCHDVLLPAPFETSCSAWICPLPNYRPALCLTLQAYAHACQRLGVSIDSWRFQTGCPIECPHNSHYEPCGSSCPETCMGRLRASCPLPCGETCACDAGYVHSGPACVLRRPGPGGCGCTYQGRLLGPGETLWEGVGCTRRCVCPASGGSVICTQAGCRPGERCVLSLGLRTCVPSSMATCVVAGGGHYITFDGRRFRFPGSCVYLLSGLTSPAPQELADFRVLLGTGPDGLPGSLEVFVSGCHLRLDPKEPSRILVNGDWQNLPFQALSNSTLIFRHGWDTVVSCHFGLRVTYAPGIRVVVDLPAAYMGHVVGLCADYNGDPMDDLQVPGIVLGTKLPEDALVWAFGRSYVVGSPTGCLNVADKMPPLPPSCVTLLATSTPAHFAHICDILLDPLGPFQLCHEMLAPGPYVQDCMVDVCLGIGPCPMLSLYCETCQLLGGQVFPWRKSSLCSPLCPAHSRYTLCAPDCSDTCAGLKPPPGCDGPGLCREGCVCDAGFLLSGADCVPAAQCGCLSAGRYLEPGAPLSSPHPATGRCCRCRPGGRVVCKPCRAAAGGPGLCLASDGLRYRTFDGTTFHLPGACTYSLVSTGTGRLRGVWPFEVALEKSPRTPEVRRALLCVHGHRFGLDWEDWGYITVDGVRRCLPFALTRGRVRAFARGASVVLAVRGGPRLLFGLGGHLSVELPAAYRGLTRGLCGNFNGKASDDLQLPRPGPCAAPRPCPGSGCPPAAEDAGADTAWRGSCDLLREPSGPLAPCHALLPPEPFFQACVADMGRARGNRKVLCAFLQAYVAACQTAAMRCPPNSHYSLCANPCPAACPGVQEVVRLPTPCAEGCECEDGFFPAGRDCVPADHCPCFHDGQYFPPGQTVLIQNCSSSCTCQLGEGVACVPFSCPTEECLPGYLLLGGRCVPRDHCSCFLHQGRTFWRDNCTQQCHCPTLGAPGSKLPQCWPDKCHGHCKASTGGWYQCLLAQSPPSPTVLEKSLVCMATGDFHLHTFGGTHYEFPGSCVYRLAGLCGTAPANLQHFSLDLTPLLRPRGWTKALTLLACGLRLDMSPKDLNRIRVDGILESLPFFHGHCLRAYYQGRQLCVDTDFGLSLTYDWDSLARVTLPGPYGPYLCGLCGQDGPSSSTVPVPDTWKVAEVPGCGPFCGSLCPSPCPVTKRPQFAGDAYCGLLAAAEGPFGPCYAALDPLPFMDNCLDDVCRHYGAHHIVCRALAAFTVACQALGVHLRPWRTPDFCPWRCPPHSHYELCGPCCPATCAGGESCSGRGASGSRCCEGCVCDAGFVLSGAACVPEAKCGCFRAGRYRALGAVWYPGPRCARRCRCGPGGVVTCAPRPCQRGRVCGLRGGERRCLPEGRGSCALAGRAHVLAFDGRVLTLPPPAPSPSERCLHVLARTASRGPCPFSLDVARDGAGLLSLHLNLSGHHLQLDRTLVGVITVDGEHCRLPWVLAEGRAWATLEGRHVVVHTACGLHLMYDWGSQVRLTVPSTFHGQLVGICGAFGGKVGPLDLPLDKRSWPKGLVTNPCPLPQPNLDFSISCPTQLAQIVNASELCRLLQAPDGPFGRCLGHISPKPFLRICLQDICHTRGQHLGLCDALTAFTAACQEAGIPVKLWRGPKLCPMACPPRSRYSICARTCDGSCVQPTSPAHCSTQCYEGCQCDPGLIFDGTDCVSQDHCGCFHSGRYIPVREVPRHGRVGAEFPISRHKMFPGPHCISQHLQLK
ncbi:IgGFc-binding protein-like [Phoca vitulina]|uniref:IgGFc-binding protein-like n=1 Tax=Phoca vitulina TaxID=9720 RepID=UPI001396197E|nr:IgGFc-binding protein-like [Phoca vitulina]